MSTVGVDQPSSQPSHHSTYATFRSLKSSSSVLSEIPRHQSNDYPNVLTNPNSRGSSVVSSIIRSTSFISAEEEASHRLMRGSVSQPPQPPPPPPQTVKLHQTISSPVPNVTVPASFSEHLLSLDHADSLMMTSSSTSSSSNDTSSQSQLVQHHSSLPQNLISPSLAAESQRSLVSSAGYHSSSSMASAVGQQPTSASTRAQATRSLVLDDSGPPSSSASSSSSSSRQSNIENSNTSNQNDFFVKPPSSPSSNSNGQTLPSFSSAYVPRCSSAYTALAAIDEELPPLQQHEIAQVDIFYRSLKTEVRVSSSMAQMFLEETVSLTEEPDQIASGVPLLLLDKFPTQHSARSSTKRPQSPAKQVLYLILAERGTGFTLKRERISQRDCYTLASCAADTHRLTVTGSQGQKTVYLIKFSSAMAAGQFFASYTDLTKGDSVFSPSSKKSGSQNNGFSSWWKGKLPSKLSLSRPCCFRHLTNLDSSYLSLSQTSVVASPEHRMSQPCISQTLSDPRGGTMPRRSSAAVLPSSHSPLSNPPSKPSSTASGPVVRPSSFSPMVTSMPCRVSLSPLAACPPIAPSLG